MPATYEKIQSTTLGAAAAGITFSTISAAYTDLRLVLTGSFTTADRPALQYNSDTASNYSRTLLNGDGASAQSFRTSNATRIFVGATQSSQINMTTFDIFSYAGSTFKTCLITRSADNNGSGDVDCQVGLYRSSTAISTIYLFGQAGNNYAAGTTATLYGILKA
jgi:hypothetical protein